MHLRQTIRLDWVTSRAKNQIGGFTPTWDVARGNVPALIQPASTSYAMLGQQLRAQVTHVVYIREEQRPFIKVGGVVVYKARTFEILGVIDMAESLRMLKLECREGAPAAYKDPLEDEYSGS